MAPVHALQNCRCLNICGPIMQRRVSAGQVLCTLLMQTAAPRPAADLAAPPHHVVPRNEQLARSAARCALPCSISI